MKIGTVTAAVATAMVGRTGNSNTKPTKVVHFPYRQPRPRKIELFRSATILSLARFHPWSLGYGVIWKKVSSSPPKNRSRSMDGN
jgi:hypothetical protein